jgi:hypothetical protein
LEVVLEAFQEVVGVEVQEEEVVVPLFLAKGEVVEEGHPHCPT